MGNLIEQAGVHIRPVVTSLHVPPVVWKGDPVGHIGECDVFFWVLEGECFLKIESEYSVIQAGQLAFLPKGKMRTYTQVSPNFTMYEMAFSATVDGKNLMQAFGFADADYVVSIEERDALSALFETTSRKEVYKNPLHDVAWCANILSIISIYGRARQKNGGGGKAFFAPVLQYMETHLTEQIRIETLARTVFMEPTYFIRKFKKEFGVPPLTYFNRMRTYRAMEHLSATDLTVEEIARCVGVEDAAYFSRMFKKLCKISPSEYRKVFH